MDSAVYTTSNFTVVFATTTLLIRTYLLFLYYLRLHGYNKDNIFRFLSAKPSSGRLAEIQ